MDGILDVPERVAGEPSPQERPIPAGVDRGNSVLSGQSRSFLMASPQTENGYTKIANEILDHLAKLRINGEAMQVLWVVFRKTYGFNKKEDAIALSQFVESTGMRKPDVCRALNKLESIGVISKKANAVANKYVFIKNYDLWKPLAKKRTLAKKRMAVSNKANNRSPKSDIQKTKETITKDIASQSDAELIVKVIDSFEEVNPNFKRWYGNTTQRGAIDRMLVDHGLDTLLKVISLLPKTNAKAYFPTITTPLQLETDWAKLKSKLQQEKDKTTSKGRGFVN